MTKYYYSHVKPSQTLEPPRWHGDAFGIVLILPEQPLLQCPFYHDVVSYRKLEESSQIAETIWVGHVYYTCKLDLMWNLNRHVLKYAQQNIAYAQQNKPTYCTCEVWALILPITVRHLLHWHSAKESMHSPSCLRRRTVFALVTNVTTLLPGGITNASSACALWVHAPLVEHRSFWQSRARQCAHGIRDVG